ncbi:MAG: FAD:protein FMN transferase, partial [Bacillota bacterium]|nr:FAD:protein FMN transferase [Bacillota bacterium]
MLKKIMAVMITAVLAVSMGACSGIRNAASKDDSKVSERNLTNMDTIITLKAYGANSDAANDEAAKKINELDKMCSTNLEGSDVYNINQAAGKNFVKVHPEVLKMIKTSIEYSKLSGGAFDISVGPLINLWKIGTPEA